MPLPQYEPPIQKLYRPFNAACHVTATPAAVVLTWSIPIRAGAACADEVATPTAITTRQAA
jgi:hypothetical protein